MKKIVCVVLLAMAVSGCAQQTFNMKSDKAYAPKETQMQHFFIGGIGQEKTIDAAKICGGENKVIRTEVQETFVDGLLASLTMGIYTPREARVYCTL